MTLNLKELETLLAAATPGPWFNDQDDTIVESATEMIGQNILAGSHERDLANTELIVALRNAAPALIARVKELEEWMPIETAPKDGMDIIIFVPEMETPFSAHWDKEFEYILNEEDSTSGYRGAWTDNSVKSWGYEEYNEYLPTHWKRLPKVPPAPLTINP